MLFVNVVCLFFCFFFVKCKRFSPPLTYLYAPLGRRAPLVGNSWCRVLHYQVIYKRTPAKLSNTTFLYFYICNQDIVDDPEQHLQLDGNGDISINLDQMEDLEEEIQEEEAMVAVPAPPPPPPVEVSSEPEPPPQEPAVPPAVKEEPKKQEEKKVEKPPVIDPFEFSEDPVIFESPQAMKSASGKQENKQYVPHYQQEASSRVQSQPQPQPSPQLQPQQPKEEELQPKSAETVQPTIETEEPVLIKEEPVTETIPSEQSVSDDSVIQIKVKVEEQNDNKEEEVNPDKPSAPRGSVEIVEHKEADSEEDSQEFNQTQIEEIVQSVKPDNLEEIKSEKLDVEEEKKTEIETESYTTESKDTASVEESSETSDTLPEIKKEPVNLDTQDSLEMPSTAPEFSEDLYDELSMEVKIDKTGKTRRDYSRTKKKEDNKEDHGFDMLLAIEKSQMEDTELTEETLSDNTTEPEKKEVKPQLKSENERSSSPWTEDEDAAKVKRRYSTPATPVDSIPNSPASSTAFYEDDKEYKSWKKSVMLVYSRLASNKYASLFLKPITDDQAPGYSSIVYRPMDLQTIKKNIENGIIRTTLEFKRDAMLMFTNAMMYNKTKDTIYDMAKQMQEEAMQQFEFLMQVQAQQDVPLRRETRTSESGIKRKRTVTLSEDPKKRKKED
ncbi:unnamed protein product [Acanthoscelides obtectus]|uniref:Bromo domain-containing protein n=1 Tax=Acanthoscelides obtectus TaxID=200917 RepID=A0A9P0PVN3_ACAOB|nr:unnamed protein product [Acanthoscelides obtectus]CAK1671541.1 Bromodomain-containing protein 8 [Acanthoscelides obtectus]